MAVGPLAVAALAVLTLALVAAWAWLGVARRRAEASLTGMWAGDPGFLARAGLSDMQLYIGPPGPKGLRQGYLIIADSAGGLLANHPVRLRAGRAAATGCAFRAQGDAVRTDLRVEGGGLPPRLRMTLSVLDGTLTLHDGRAVHAFLGKDPSASAAAAAALSGCAGGAPPADAGPGPDADADADADIDVDSVADSDADIDADSVAGIDADIDAGGSAGGSAGGGFAGGA